MFRGLSLFVSPLGFQDVLIAAIMGCCSPQTLSVARPLFRVRLSALAQNAQVVVAETLEGKYVQPAVVDEEAITALTSYEEPPAALHRLAQAIRPAQL
eukprot:5575266-Amphidinium_carterae.1